MKKRLVSIGLVLTILVTLLATFTVVGAEEELVYSQGFGSYASDIPEGKTWYQFTNGTNNSTWHAGTAGSHGVVWLVNDNKAKNGPYLVAKPYNDSNKLYYLTQYNDVESGKKGRLAFTKSFVFEFSFNFLSKRPDGQNSAGTPNIMVNIFPEASTTSNGRSGEGNILSIPYNGTITAVNDAATVNGNAYTTSKDVWYDVRVIADMSTETPTYSAYIKKSADSEYTAVVEDMSFPKNGNYSKGLGLFSILTLRQNSTYALDDLKIYYYNEKHTVTLSECENGSLSFAEGFSSPVEKGESVTINVTPASGYQVKDGKVKVNGAEYTVSNGQITFAVNEDSTVEAEFEEIPVVAPSVTTGDAKPAAYGTKKAIIVYGTINEFTTTAPVQYGIKLWEDNKDDAATLSAYVRDEETQKDVVDFATPGKVFAIKVFGDGYITSGKTFNACTFVGDTEGGEKSVTID